MCAIGLTDASGPIFPDSNLNFRWTASFWATSQEFSYLLSIYSPEQPLILSRLFPLYGRIFLRAEESAGCPIIETNFE
jgi:hypothetical protein